MTSKLVVGPINAGLRNNRTAFVIDNDSFPTLINAYQWRGRVKRKRGTSLLCRLQRFFNSLLSSYNSGSTTIVLGNDGFGNGTGNLLTGFTTLESNASIVPGTITINDVTNASTYTDPDKDGTLRKGGVADPGSTIDYSSGSFVIAGRAGDTVNAKFTYFPSLPVMGIEDFVFNSDQFPGTIAFDTKYSYNIVTASPYPSYNVSFFKNPAADPVNLPGYVPKTNETPVTWNGQDYQQFWTVNYQGALWATNGINEPFSITNIGMQFTAVTNVAAPVANTVNITVTGANLVVGDFVFANEFDPAIITGINFQAGYVIAGAAPGVVTVEFPFATLAGAGGVTTKGILQYLTNRSDFTKDNIRWYDGDPTNGSITNPLLTGTKGWVNFMPPLSQSNFSIADLPAAQYYLVGARLIIAFKDRLLFFGPVVQTSSAGSQVYLQDTVIYSQNGTPYYTSSFTSGANYPLQPVTTPPGYSSVLLPTNQTATPSAWFEDSTGFGGFITAGIDQNILTVAPNQDVLIVGFSETQTRLVYTGNDIIPFNFYIVNSELGSSSTFTSVIMDQGVLTRGSRGIIATSQTNAERIDLDIPDQVFQMRLTNNGPERHCAQRDFINEWIYFTYPTNMTDDATYRFPNQTLQYNYRDNSWAILNETYTTYGSFRKQTGFTWQTVGLIYPTWNSWNDPWNAGVSTLLQPQVAGGNQQGFIMIRENGTNEGTSLYIQSISGSTITSPDHGLNQGDFILISGALGTISTLINNQIFQVGLVTENTFTLNPNIGSGTYLGGGLIIRMYVPMIQTKQFPVAWSDARKVRIGVQRYLLTTTQISQIQLLIFLSQNSASAYNLGNIVPQSGVVNNSLIYSTVLYTCPESTNIGLTPANVNLQMPTAIDQEQIWHRINTSLIGDTVQLGFTISDDQMRMVDGNGNTVNAFSEIELHGFTMDVFPSQMLV